MIDQSTAQSMIPIRIGGLVPHGSLLCVGCGTDGEGVPPHVQPRLRFTLLAWTPVLTEEHARAHDFPCFGSARDKPVEIAGVRSVVGDEGAVEFVRYMSWN